MTTQAPRTMTADGYRQALAHTRASIIRVAVVMGTPAHLIDQHWADRVQSAIDDVVALDTAAQDHRPPKAFKLVHINWGRATAKFVEAMDEVAGLSNRAESGEMLADDDWKRARACIKAGVFHLTQADHQLARATRRTKNARVS